jgi:hypothetical protein
MKKIFLTTIIVLAAASTTFGQRCGGSTNYIFIYVRDGIKLQNPRYELFSVSPTGLLYDDPKLARFVSTTLFADDEPKRPTFWRMESFIIKPELVEKFLKTYNAGDYDAAPRWRPLKKEEFSGPIKNGQINLPTGEMFDYPYILKIYADNRNPVYILSAHLGGCFPSERIIWDDTVQRAYWERWND